MRINRGRRVLAFHRCTIVFFGAMLFLSCGSSGEGDDDDTAPGGPNTPPSAVITSPEDVSSVPVEETIVLEGLVDDAETPLELLYVEWLSDVEGTLGMPIPDTEGRVVLEHTFFVPVEQVIALRVSDAEGLIAEAHITLYVNTAPSAMIESISPSEPRSDQTLMVTGKVSDEQDDPRHLSIEWYLGTRFLGDDPADKNGNVEVLIEDLPAGVQTLSLIATDSGGLRDEDSITIEVLECDDADDDGISDCDGDCDEYDPFIYPGADELCDGLDQDCDGIVDEGFPDVDGDKIMDCVDVEECDGIDNDGDTLVDEGFDLDLDGFTTCEGDCDDEDENVSPDGIEVCDGVDQDCNGIADDDFPDTDGDMIMDCIDVEECDGLDNDGDGLIDEGFDLDADGFTLCEGDCDDGDEDISPAEIEVCDGVDQDCDGVVDNGFDVDGDGYSTCAGDCDDTNVFNHPGADEVVCDAVDNDCDGLIDEDQYEPNEYLDAAYYLGDLNETEEGTISIFQLEATMHEGDGSDFYKFFVIDDFAWGDDTFYVSVLLENIPEGADYDLYLYWDDPDDWYFSGIQEREASESAGNRDEQVYEDGTAGPDNGGYYWIEVRAVETSVCDTPYTLTIENTG